jgi:hypothetical protein
MILRRVKKMPNKKDENVNRGTSVFSTGVGQDAFRHAYEQGLDYIAGQRERVGQDYAGMYQQARRHEFARGLGAGSSMAGMSGGQRDTYQQRIGAQQMQALTAIQSAQERALGEVEGQKSGLYSQALSEGQQAEQYYLQAQEAILNRQRILLDIANAEGDYKKMSKADRAKLLREMGENEMADELLKSPSSTALQHYFEQQGSSTTAPPYSIEWWNEISRHLRWGI